MKNVVLVLFVALIVAPFALAGPKTFTLKNSTGAVITELYISPSLLDDWGNNILPVKALKPGQEAKIPCPTSAEVDLWDLKTVDGKGEATEWPGIALADISVVTLSFQEGEPVASYD